MGETISANEVRSTLRTFQEYLRDLAEARFESFGTKLRLLVNFAEMDATFRVLAQRFHVMGAEAREWFLSASQSGTARPLPEDPVARLAHQYKILMDLKQQRIDVRSFLSTLFTSGSIQEAHKRFIGAWIEPMRASMARLAERVDQEIGAKESVKLDEVMDAALEGISAAARPKAAPAPAPAPAKAAPAKAPAEPAPAKAKGKKAKAVAAVQEAAAFAGLDVDGLVKLLEKTAKGAKELAAKVKADVEVDVKILKLELTKHVPDMGVVSRVAEPLQKTGGKIAEIAAALAQRARE